MLSFTCHVSAKLHIRSKDSKPFEFFLAATPYLLLIHLCAIKEFHKFGNVSVSEDFCAQDRLKKTVKIPKGSI